jgi:hypothetical protein
VGFVVADARFAKANQRTITGWRLADRQNTQMPESVC